MIYSKKKGNWKKEGCRVHTPATIEGLQYLHSYCRHVHCNLKCSNILVDRDGSIKLADYGRFGCLKGKV